MPIVLVGANNLKAKQYTICTNSRRRITSRRARSSFFIGHELMKFVSKREEGQLPDLMQLLRFVKMGVVGRFSTVLGQLSGEANP
ncbi:MAG: hypothetical protein PSX36_02290 [bacterium]|nr:hypothetical protein [bacterium]